MNLSALLLSRLEFAFTVSFHIIFPSFTIGAGGVAYRAREGYENDQNMLLLERSA